MGKLTNAQKRALVAIAYDNDAGRTSHVDRLPCNRGVLERLESLGLIHSARPFAGAYHTVTITPAGRAALEQSND